VPAIRRAGGKCLKESGVTCPNSEDGTRGWLRDSDPFSGAITRRAQPNYAVAFELPVP